MTEAAHPPLAALAEAAGVAPRWRDFEGEWHEVAEGTLRAVLAAMDLPAETDAQMAESRAGLAEEGARLPPLLTATVGEPIRGADRGAVHAGAGGRRQARSVAGSRAG